MFRLDWADILVPIDIGPDEDGFDESIRDGERDEESALANGTEDDSDKRDAPV